MLQTGNYKIKWRHRVSTDTTYKMDSSAPKPNINGETECLIGVVNGSSIIGKATATCSKEDNFSYDIGRKVSLARCMNFCSFKKKIRKEIWDAYRDMVEGGRW